MTVAAVSTKAASKPTLEGQKAKVIAFLLKGNTSVATAARFKAGRKAVDAFRRRHAPEIEAARAKLASKSVDNWIIDKEKRLEVLRELVEAEMVIFHTRGLEAEDVKIAANGDQVSVRYFDKALASEIRAGLDDAATEMGERQKAPLIDARTQVNNFIGLMEALQE